MEINESLILTKTSSGDLSPSLTSQEARIVLSSQGSKIKDLKKKDVANKVTDLFGSALVVMNHSNKIGKEDRLAMEQVIVNDLFEKFQFYTLKEVENSFWMGSRGQLKNKPDEVVYMSIAQIYQWLTNYRTVIKREALRKQMQFEEKKEHENIKEKIKQSEIIWRQETINEYNNFLEGKEVRDPVSDIYDRLDKLGLIKLSNERKREIYNKCLSDFRQKHERGNSISDYAENKKILHDMDKGASYIQSKIKILAKQKALLITFQDIKESGLTIEDYLNDTNT